MGTASDAFTQACAFVMPLGQHKGKTIARIGANTDGLRYLDWLIGQDWVNGKLRVVLGTYLRHPAVARELETLLED